MRLISYNIHKGIGGIDRRYNLDRVCAVIQREHPDLICLQEVTRNARRTSFDDQPRLLADLFQAEASCFQNNVHYRVGGYGNLILSRWPFRSKHQLSLQLKNKKPRGAQVVVVVTPEGPLHLANWHLGLGEKERHWQVRHLMSHPAFRESLDLPTLIVGDFNDWRNTLAKGPFAEHDFELATRPPSRFRSFPAYWPMLSLDKAFHRGAVRVKEARLVRSPNATWASDHLPLVLDFHLKGHS